MRSRHLLLVLAASAFADDLPDGARVKSMGFAGTACPGYSDTVSLDFGQGMLISMGLKANVSVGPGSSPRDQRKACTFNIEFAYPYGLEFAPVLADTSVSFNLSEGVTGQLRYSAFYSGKSGVASATYSIPSGSGVTTLNETSLSPSLSPLETFWSGCGTERVINLQTSIALQSRDPESFGHGQLKRTGWDFKWRSCTPPYQAVNSFKSAPAQTNSSSILRRSLVSRPRKLDAI